MNNDKDLFRQALQRQNERAARMKMPDDMEQRVMQRISPKKSIRHWHYTAIAAVAASILLLLVFRFSQEPVKEQPVEAVPIVAEATPQPVPQPIIEEKKEEVLAEVQPMTKLVSKHRKAVKNQNTPIEEPVLAQAEQPIQEQGQDFEPMYAQAEEYDTHYQTIQTVHLSSDVVMHVIEASDIPAATTVPSVSELRARGLLLTNNVQQASQTTVKF